MTLLRMSRELSIHASSFANHFSHPQYPHQSSNGRRELRAMEKENGNAQHRTSENGTSQHLLSENGQHNHRSSAASVSTAIHVPSSGDRDSDDFNHRYNERRTTMQSDGPTDRFAKSAMAQKPTEISFNDDAAPSEFTSRGIHIPTRTRYVSAATAHCIASEMYSNLHLYSSSGKQVSNAVPMASSPATSPGQAYHAQNSSPPSPYATQEHAYDAGGRSSAGSTFSQETVATSVHTLPALQTRGPENGDVQYLEPVLEDDPASWDLVGPAQEEEASGMYALEKRAEKLLSADHLKMIFEDPKLLLRFTGFLNTHRPKSIPILIYYLDALKALRAINYANAIAEALEPIKGQDFTQKGAKPTNNAMLEDKANRAFNVLVQEDLPAYIAHTWTQVVSVSIQRRITGTLAPHLREASEGLAEVFCLSDPSRTDNPIVFASEEFNRTTQYGMNYAIGRNCRFLQGPQTSPHSVRRLAIACAEGKEHSEVFVNYRRDGSPFMNLLMIAPLMDSRGTIRYFIGAQVDVSGLIKDCSEMEGLTNLLEREEGNEGAVVASHKDEFQELSEMFNGAELDTVRKHGGRMHKEYVDDSDRESLHGRSRLLLKDNTQEAFAKEEPGRSPSSASERVNGKLQGVYQDVSCVALLELDDANNFAVYPHPTGTVLPHTVHITITSGSWNPPVAIPSSNWRQQPRSTRSECCTCRGPWCDSQGPMADSARRGW